MKQIIKLKNNNNLIIIEKNSILQIIKDEIKLKKKNFHNY